MGCRLLTACVPALAVVSSNWYVSSIRCDIVTRRCIVLALLGFTPLSSHAASPHDLPRATSLTSRQQVSQNVTVLPASNCLF